MKSCCDYIIEELKEKSIKKFDGSLRIGFEKGHIVSYTESNSPELADFQMKAGVSDEVYSLISTFNNSGANGSIVMTFKNGIISKWGYARSYRGEDLKKLWGAI